MAKIVPAAESTSTVPASRNLGFENLARESTLRRCIYPHKTIDKGFSLLTFISRNRNPLTEGHDFQEWIILYKFNRESLFKNSRYLAIDTQVLSPLARGITPSGSSGNKSGLDSFATVLTSHMWSWRIEARPGWPLPEHVLHTFCTCVSPILVRVVHVFGPQGGCPMPSRASPEVKGKCGLVVPADHPDALTTSRVRFWERTGHNACNRKIGMPVACREQPSTAFPRIVHPLENAGHSRVRIQNRKAEPRIVESPKSMPHLIRGESSHYYRQIFRFRKSNRARGFLAF